MFSGMESKGTDGPKRQAGSRAEGGACLLQGGGRCMLTGGGRRMSTAGRREVHVDIHLACLLQTRRFRAATLADAQGIARASAPPTNNTDQGEHCSNKTPAARERRRKKWERERAL